MFTVKTFEARTLTWWNQQRKNIDMEPPYQRKGGLWSTRDKAFLVDSILNDFDIPKFYLADFTYANSELNSKRLRYAVIDGKQRLEAIFDFFDNKFVLDDAFEYSDDPTLKLAGLSYTDLKATQPEIASKFENFNPSVMSVITDDEAKINELFVRLNRNKPLVGAEIRNAMSGVVPDEIRTLAAHQFFKKNVKFKKERGEDKNVAAKLLLIEFRGSFVDTKKVQLDRFVEEGQKAESTDITRASRRVKNNLNHMSKIFTPNDELLRSQGPIPVYYWLVRSLKDTYHNKVREFLIQFESERQQNRERAKAGKGAVNKDLVVYDTLDRSTNDQNSLEGRFQILAQVFANHVGGKNPFRD